MAAPVASGRAVIRAAEAGPTSGTDLLPSSLRLPAPVYGARLWQVGLPLFSIVRMPLTSFNANQQSTRVGLPAV